MGNGMRRYVIVGAGVAGIAAAENIIHADPTGEVIIICEEAEGYYSRPGLAYFLTHEIPEAQLFPMDKGDYHRHGIQIVHAQAELILPQDRQLRLANSHHFGYDRLLIATGSQASPLRMPGSEAEGVVKLDCIADAKRIHKLARKGRSAVVVGGGSLPWKSSKGCVRMACRSITCCVGIDIGVMSWMRPSQKLSSTG
jgi:3-phenylpropionate/trans-cinnamate dioxygenase ferredoxin reductase subunit